MSTRSISVNLGDTSSPVLDASFPRVAAKAALEVDGALLQMTGKHPPKELKPDAVMALLPVLKKFAQSLTRPQSAAGGQDSTVTFLVDPASQRVFMLAFEIASQTPSPRSEPSLNDLGQATGRVAKVLEDVAKKIKTGFVPTEEATEIAFARDFCRALSNQSAVRQISPHFGYSQGLRRR